MKEKARQFMAAGIMRTPFVLLSSGVLKKAL